MKDREEVEATLNYVSQFVMNITGFIHLEWEWQSDYDVVIYNAPDSEGSLSDDNAECAELVARLTGWSVYPITDYDGYDQYSGEPFKVGLRKQ